MGATLDLSPAAKAALIATIAAAIEVAIAEGRIWPEPLVEIMILALTGLSGPYPASFNSAFALAGS